MPTLKQWNSSANWYEQNMGESGDNLNNKIIKPAILKTLGNLSGKKILDAGCGSGYFSKELAKKARSVAGCDFSENFIKICKEKYLNDKKLSFSQQNLEKKLLFKKEYFDVIVSKMVLQYIDNIDVFTKESFRVLKKTGEVVIVVDHPFHAQFYYAQKLAGKTNPKYKNLNNYFYQKPLNKISLWGKVKLTWYPRTIADYVNTFLGVGFNLSKIIELPGEEKDIIIPRILILVFKK